MNNHEVIIQKALEKERKIQNLNNLLVNQFDKAIHTGNALTNGQDVIISFDIQCITSELRDLFFERLNNYRTKIYNADEAGIIIIMTYAEKYFSW